MEGRWWSRGARSGRLILPLSALLLLAGPPAALLARNTHGENVHRPDADCTACHTADRDRLEEAKGEARALVAPDLEERCILCHGDEGPSHHTGIRPRKPVPDTLPLSAEGLITCATCHLLHGERDPFPDFLRVDNARGGLCLTCHELSELE